ncbi:hypothetical protein C8Q79DRAFT_915265 [Trametes meyenii]|nr:hypothetical protein C8Q79DRAFT_915265 [Trametes meyenii]
MTCEDFPSEIIDAIIDHLHDDRDALHSCALVCARWLSESRHHLFANFLAHPQKCALTDLLQFLTSTPDVGGHIKSFSLTGYHGISLKDIVVILNALPNLHIVNLNGLVVSKPLRDDPPLTAAIKELSMVSIGPCNYKKDTFEALFRLLGLFTVVRTLRLSQGFRFEASEADACILEVPTALRVTELFANSVPASVIGQLIRPTRLAQWETLRSLELYDCITKWEQVAEVGKLLSEIGPRLRRLGMRPSSRLISRFDQIFGGGALMAGGWNPIVPASIAGTEDTRAKWAPLGLSKCVNLEEFVFQLNYGEYQPFYDCEALFKLHMDLVSHLPTCVRTVKISLLPVPLPVSGAPVANLADGEAASGGPLGRLDWPLLDETLSDHKFKRMRVVIDVGMFKYQFTVGDSQAIVAFLTGSLHRLRRRGALVFEFPDHRIA